MQASYFTPLEFGCISDKIYRSSYPAKKTLEFISRLGLRSMICLNPLDLNNDLIKFCSSNNVEIFECDIGFNQEPFISMNADAVRSTVNYAMNPINQPCLVFCNNGKSRTSCVTGCIRKHLGWSQTSISFEYEKYMGQDRLALDLQFIESFKVEPPPS